MITRVRWKMIAAALTSTGAPLFVLLTFFWVAELRGAVYFVDFTSGNDIANGLTTASAFKHCPGDQAATGNANRILAAGDTVVFAGGVTYALSAGLYIELNASGTFSLTKSLLP